MNNRAIKFRIWSKEFKTWLCEDSQYLVMDGSEVIAAPWSTINFRTDNENYVIQQFTGFKDETGKEVYEGDIVEFVYWVGDFALMDMTEEEFKKNQKEIGQKILGQLAWNETMGAFYIISGNPEASHSMFPATYAGHVGAKVLGNIFENPELLK